MSPQPPQKRSTPRHGRPLIRSAPVNPSLHRRAVVALFFCSGLSSLVLETVWVRQMILVFGSTTFAVSTVLTAFMAGLALGSYLAGRHTTGRQDDPRRSLLIYGALELGIGLYALLMPVLVARLPDLHGLLWGSMHSGGGYHGFALVRFVLAAALLALPTLAMGATLPVLAHYFAAAGQGGPAGRTVGSLYAVNTAGAVAGVFLAGFVLLPGIGLMATNLAACITDVLLAVGAVALYRAAARPAAEASPAPPTDGAGASSPLARAALVSVAVSGALAMINQVAWTRSLSLVLGSSTYAFSLILLAFLLGLAAGAALYARRQAGDADQAANLSLVHLMTGLTCAFGPLVAMDRIPLVLLTLLQQLTLTPALVFALKFALAGVVVFLPTFFMGMVFPAVVQIYAAGRRQDLGAITGTVYAINTMGAIVGSFLGGFVLVPLVGLRHTLLLAVGGSLVLGLLFALASARRRTRLALACVALALLAGLYPLARPWNLEVLTSGVFRISRFAGTGSGSMPGAGDARDARPGPGAASPGARRYLAWLEAALAAVPPARIPDSFTEPQSGYRVVRHAEGITTTVSMGRAVDFSLSAAACWVRTSLLVNGKPDASLSVLHARPSGGCHTLLDPAGLDPPLEGALRLSPQGDTETQMLSGLLPYLLNPGSTDPRTALVIGWGSGVTVGAALDTPLRSIVAAELESEVIQAARLFEPFNGTPQDDRRLTLLEADGRNLLASGADAFDVIISEPSNPWISGCGNLFTREFFELVRSHLTSDGVFLQWVQAYEISPENVWSILATINSVFPRVFVFSPSRAASDLLIVAMREGRGKVPWARAQQRMSRSRVRARLRPLGLNTPADLAVRLLAAPEGVRQVGRGAPLNTDDNARIEFNAPKDLINFKKFRAAVILRRLQATLSDPAGALFSDVPRDAPARLCLAGLGAGRSRQIPPETKGESESMGRCRRLAAALQRPLPGLPALRLAAREALGPSMTSSLSSALTLSQDAAPDALALALDPTSASTQARHAMFAVLGHLAALGENPFDALAFLLAARELEQELSGPTYSLLTRVLARQLSVSGLHREASLILDLTQ